MRRRTFVATAASTVATTSLAGCGFLGGGDDGDSPEQVVRDAAAALEDEDLEALQELYHSESDEAPEEGDFENVTYEEVSVESIEVVEENDDTATVEATMSMTAEVMGQNVEDESTTQFELRREDGEWRIYSSENV